MASCCSVPTPCGFQSSDTRSLCGTVHSANTSFTCEHISGNCPPQRSRSQSLLHPSPSVVNRCNPIFHFRDISRDNPLQTVKLCVTFAASREAQSLISPGRSEDPFGWSPCYAVRCKPTRIPIGTETANSDTRRRRVTMTTVNRPNERHQATSPAHPGSSHPDKRDLQVAQRTQGWAPRALNTEA
jgi:hypothetical protein